MSLVSFPLDVIKQAFPYLEKYYEFSCWSINENLERACYDNDLVVDVLPKYWESRTFDVFPEDLKIIFDMPHYEKLLELQNKYPTLLDENHLPFYVLMLAPYVNPVLHPYTEEEIAALEDAERSKDIANVYRFLKTIQADGFKIFTYGQRAGKCFHIQFPELVGGDDREGIFEKSVSVG